MSPDIRAPEYKEADHKAAQHRGFPARRARQGVMGHNVRYVLGFGLLGIVVAFLVVYLFFFA